MNTEDVERLFEVSGLVKLPSGSYVKTEVFAKLFREASSKPTYKELVRLDNDKGYIPFFDECKEQGILD